VKTGTGGSGYAVHPFPGVVAVPVARKSTAPESLHALIAAAFGGRLVASINETAEALRCNRDTVHRWINDGKLTSSLVGHRRLVHTRSIVQLLEDTVDNSRQPRAPRKAPEGKTAAGVTCATAPQTLTLAKAREAKGRAKRRPGKGMLRRADLAAPRR
jgi:excisionase family DNA binding protein